MFKILVKQNLQKIKAINMKVEKRKSRNNKITKKSKITRNKQVKQELSNEPLQFFNNKRDNDQMEMGPYLFKNAGNTVSSEELYDELYMREKIDEARKLYSKTVSINNPLNPSYKNKTTLSTQFLNDKTIPDVVKSFIVSSTWQQNTNHLKRDICKIIKNLLFELETCDNDPNLEEEEYKIIYDVRKLLPEFQTIIGFSPDEYREFSVRPKFPSQNPNSDKKRIVILQDIKNILNRLKKDKKKKETNEKTLPSKPKYSENPHARFRTTLPTPRVDNKQNAPLVNESLKKRDIEDVLKDLKHFLPERKPYSPLTVEEQYQQYLGYPDENNMVTPPCSRQERCTEDILEDMKEMIPELQQTQRIINNLTNKDFHHATKKVVQLETRSPSTVLLENLQKKIGMEKIEQVQSWLKRREILRIKDKDNFHELFMSNNDGI